MHKLLSNYHDPDGFGWLLWLSNHNIKPDWLITPIHDNLSKALKAESLVYSHILASTGLKIAGFMLLIGL